MRSVSVSRDGDDVVIRWDQLTANGKTTELFFERLDTQQAAKITLAPIPAGIGEYVLPAQAMSNDCGTMYGKQLDAQGQSSPPSIGSELGSPDPNQHLGVSYGDECATAPAAPAPGQCC